MCESSIDKDQTFYLFREGYQYRFNESARLDVLTNLPKPEALCHYFKDVCDAL